MVKIRKGKDSNLNNSVPTKYIAILCFGEKPRVTSLFFINDFLFPVITKKPLKNPKNISLKAFQHIFQIYFQFGIVTCQVCEGKFDFKDILLHISHSKPCEAAYPKEDLNILTMKIQERRQHLKKNDYEESYAGAMAASQQEREQTRQRRSIEFQKRHLESVESYKAGREKASRLYNKIGKECLLERIEEIPWINHTAVIEAEVALMKEEIEALFLRFEKEIDKVASEVKSFNDYNPIAEKYDPLHGGGRGSGYLIINDWKKLKTKFGLRLQEIADEIQKPIKCFLCPSIEDERYCERCKSRKNNN